MGIKGETCDTGGRSCEHEGQIAPIHVKGRLGTAFPGFELEFPRRLLVSRGKGRENVNSLSRNRDFTVIPEASLSHLI